MNEKTCYNKLQYAFNSDNIRKDDRQYMFGKVKIWEITERR